MSCRVYKHAWWSEERVVKHLRECNKHFDGSGVALVLDARGVITGDIEDAEDPVRYKVEVPGDDRRFDAHAEARRLLAAWRDFVDEDRLARLARTL